MTENYNSHREQPLAVVRHGHTARNTAGPITWWNDGLTTYVLRFRGSDAIEQIVADEADTVIGAIEQLRTGGEMNPATLRLSLRHVRRLQTRLAAVADELLLYAREEGPDGKARLPFRAIAEETQQHFTTVSERHGRVAAGEFATWRNWLVQHTDRLTAYPADTRKRHRPAHIAKGGHQTEVYDVDTTSGEVYARCLAAGCAWETEPIGNVVTASMLGVLHEGDPANLALRTNAGPWDTEQADDADLCGRRHPSGETTCARPYAHDTAEANGAKRAQHCDPIGRTWTEDMPAESAGTR